MTKTDEIKAELAKKEAGKESEWNCEDCGQPIYEDDATVKSQGLICHDVCPETPDRGAPFEESEPMFCNKCGKVLGPESRIWECTLGLVEIGAPYFKEDYFDPTEHTDHRCEECIDPVKAYVIVGLLGGLPTDIEVFFVKEIARKRFDELMEPYEIIEVEDEFWETKTHITGYSREQKNILTIEHADIKWRSAYIES